jgi:predicted outer membrane repeat protein
MDAPRFDYLVQAFTGSANRRGLLRWLASVPPLSALVPILVEEHAAARQRRRKLRQRREARHDRVQDERKKKKKKKKKKASPLSPPPPASPPPCAPRACPADACGSVPDGCGGTLSCGGCAGNSLCHAGVCQPCDVACLSGNPAICGADLQLALGAGGTVYVCPGRYQGNFSIITSAHVIGSGDGAGPASNTVLDAHGAGRALQIAAGTGLIELERLRVIGGDLSSIGGNGAGIVHAGAPLRMTECTVSGNEGADSGGGIHSQGSLELTRCTIRDNHVTGPAVGGGIVVTGSGTATLTDCLVEVNSAEFVGGGLAIGLGPVTLAGSTQVRGNVGGIGGGIFIEAGTLTITENCRVTKNTAAPGQGGGIHSAGSTVTLQGSDPISPIVVNNCQENCVVAGGGPVAKCSTEPPVSCPP